MGFAKGVGSILASRLLFFPLKVIEFYPSQVESPYQDIRFRSEDGHALHGWFFPGRRDQTLLFLHGNAGNIGDRLDKIQFLRRVGWNIFIFDYRGYGGSEGRPTIEGVLKDTAAALRYLNETRRISNEQIVLFGESLGGALAVDLASREPFIAVILESTFTSLRDISQRNYPFIPRRLVPDRLRSVDSIRHLKSPVLVIHGTDDDLIPFEMGKKLFEAAPHPKRFLAVKKANHNDVFLAGRLDYLKAIEEFLSEAGLP
jgi:fermentation-respiration switch protein FrsA (DUF1100 family)